MSAYGGYRGYDRPPMDDRMRGSSRRDGHDDRAGGRNYHSSRSDAVPSHREPRERGDRDRDPAARDRDRGADRGAERGAAPRGAPSGAMPPPPPATATAGGSCAAALPPPPAAKPVEPAIDRMKVCPLLLRVFHRQGGHHRLEEFARVTGREEIDDEVQIYTWPDATLRELSDLVKEVQPAARRPTSRMGFALVYPDRRGHNVMRIVGQVHSSRSGEDDTKTLRAIKFQTGDYLSVAVL
mmetsp:Transcript_15893/g.47819  ORF Transcript_15893/g.47819 Transcript_15893/m.47819 type:complete len:239 (+) Transcript_15893:198-914(+)|eukprot:CAMPEP_0206142330 /NCGR_PEP_ID=MMETSP1473-20131121/16466_1 /ASSEMBLY_ACC=CAM_ASM_001109 /TAXON_ID=1461547 /ORGANISM="Stichococcus sp, Strain RCC1054" /LENGTH=238 /DNA_ID=CAMNT_0053537281 /DNA_START=182 /DNA_END=898 /DNA_ORIENTATION=-